MRLVALRRGAAGLLLSAFVAACTKDAVTSPGTGLQGSTSCPGINPGLAPARLTLPQNPPGILQTLGNGSDTVRYQAEVAVRGTTAYTTSWSVRRVQGNKVSIWDVSGNVPVLTDSLIVANATTTGDVAVTDDGSLLV